MNPEPQTFVERLAHSDLLELKRWNTPTIYNGWEQITRRDPGAECFNLEECRDFMPQMGPMVGYAVTVVFEPSKVEHRRANPDGWSQYRRYVASLPGPKIVVLQDLDKPRVIGSFWGEVSANTHRALGCVGTITDGAVRDIDEMTNAGFKAIARRFCVGHAYSHPVRWGCEVEAFGVKVAPGDLIHADKHGFLVVPREDEERLLDAARFMDSNECRTVIRAARGAAGKPYAQVLAEMDAAGTEFREAASRRFHAGGEW
jgi:regulator of RNase E activity RraA